MIHKTPGVAGFLALLLCVIGEVAAATIDTVPIGQPGNAGDPSGILPTVLVGSVPYNYRIGRTEITNAQYVDFLNAVGATDTYQIYNPVIGLTELGGIARSGDPGSYTYAVKPDVPGQGVNGAAFSYANMPLVYTSWYSALRFANWLHNGRPTGGQDSSTTEDGSYTFTGYLQVGPRNTDATWVLPNENEWYKAAYYDGQTETYYDYATGSNTLPDNNVPTNDSGNSANYWYSLLNFDYPLTEVGSYENSPSPYGTFDQTGNVWEWTETKKTSGGVITRGGSWGNDSSLMPASIRYGFNPYSDGGNSVGFRLAIVPEPSTFILFAFGLASVAIRRRLRLRTTPS